MSITRKQIQKLRADLRDRWASYVEADIAIEGLWDDVLRVLEVDHIDVADMPDVKRVVQRIIRAEAKKLRGP